MTGIVSELQFFQVEGEFIGIFTMIFHQSSFANDQDLSIPLIRLTIDDSFTMIDSHLTETI
jgi:hypothetical protein